MSSSVSGSNWSSGDFCCSAAKGCAYEVALVVKESGEPDLLCSIAGDWGDEVMVGAPILDSLRGCRSSRSLLLSSISAEVQIHELIKGCQLTLCELEK